MPRMRKGMLCMQSSLCGKYPPFPPFALQNSMKKLTDDNPPKHELDLFSDNNHSGPIFQS